MWFLYGMLHWAEMCGFYMECVVSIWNVWFLYGMLHWAEMCGFYMECYTGLKWVKKEHSLPLILSLVCQNVSEEVLLT